MVSYFRFLGDPSGDLTFNLRAILLVIFTLGGHVSIFSVSGDYRGFLKLTGDFSGFLEIFKGGFRHLI